MRNCRQQSSREHPTAQLTISGAGGAPGATVFLSFSITEPRFVLLIRSQIFLYHFYNGLLDRVVNSIIYTSCLFFCLYTIKLLCLRGKLLVSWIKEITF